jgi:uncharacterized protein (DUF305 family)
VAAVLIAVAAFCVGRLTAPVSGSPDTSSAAAGFARDMQVHHNQAVEMALIVRDRTPDDEVRLLAYDIATSQGQQSGQMYGWLESWGLPQASVDPPMTWMSLPALDGSDQHEHGDGAPETMPGYATGDQIAELEAASDVDAERIFLRLMIAHHHGGVEMAEAVIARTEQPEVLTLARGIVTAQSAEIELMESLLAERG